MLASGSLSFYLTSCISGHNTATEHTETFVKPPLKTLFLCDLCGKKDFRKRSTDLSGIKVRPASVTFSFLVFLFLHHFDYAQCEPSTPSSGQAFILNLPSPVSCEAATTQDIFQEKCAVSGSRSPHSLTH